MRWRSSNAISFLHCRSQRLDKRLLTMRWFLLSVVLIAGVAQSQEPTPAPVKSAAKSEEKAFDHKKQTTTDKRGTKGFPAVIEIEKSSVIRVETTDKTEKHRDYTDSEWWLVYLTGALAAITFFLAFYTGLLYRATVKLGKDAKTTGDRQEIEVKNSLAISKQAADAATQTVETMRDADGPYLFPEYLRFKIRDGRPTFVYTFRNYGNTPAVLNHFQDLMTFDPLAEHPFFDQDLTARPERENVIPPKGDYTEIYAGFPIGVSYEQFVSRVNGGEKLHLIGRARYEDIFGRKYTKYFCMNIAPTHMPNVVRFWIAGGKPFNRLEKEK